MSEIIVKHSVKYQYLAVIIGSYILITNSIVVERSKSSITIQKENI